ncbi:MAG: phosphotransferase [Chloroflexota bacterium]|nr:phosphotransferase [Chloroflexota bacterium]
MQLPPHADVPDHAIVEMARHHGLSSHPVIRLPDTGIFNAIYLLGDAYVLRVPRRHPLHDRALYHESIAVPLARRAGIRTPTLLVYDDSCTVFPVPYTIYEPVHGGPLGQLDLEPEETPAVWHDIGCDLARLHTGVERNGPGVRLGEREALPDPRQLAEDLASGGWITSIEARWFVRWLDRIVPAATALVEGCFSHGDLQATNIMVESPSRQYAALLDWGGAGWGDPAWDFSGVHLRAVPYLLEGYRSLAPLQDDATAEARILGRQVQLALFTARRGPQPNHSWVERPLTMLVELSRFFLTTQSPIWRDLRPM